MIVEAAPFLTQPGARIWAAYPGFGARYTAWGIPDDQNLEGGS